MDKQISIAVSGMQGSFSEAAALEYVKQKGLQNVQIVYRTNMEEALTALDEGSAMKAVIPLYNKIQGPVKPALEAMKKHPVKVVGKIKLPIAFCLLAKENTEQKDIHIIAHYPVAANQCRNFLQKNYPTTPENPRADSALAAEELSNGALSSNTAVIAPRSCVEIYPGLKIIAENIQDDPGNFTDFIIVEK